MSHMANVICAVAANHAPPPANNGAPVYFPQLVDGQYPNESNPPRDLVLIPTGTFIVKSGKASVALTPEYIGKDDTHNARHLLMPNQGHTIRAETTAQKEAFCRELMVKRDELIQFGEDIMPKYRVYHGRDELGWHLSGGAIPTSEDDLIKCYLETQE